MASDIGGVWRTIGGRRVFIKDGEDLETAMKNSGKFKSKKEDTKKKEEPEKKDEENKSSIDEKEIKNIKTQRALKDLAEEGKAEDITSWSNEENKALNDEHGRLEAVKVLHGTYGMNGALLRSKKTGQYFVITTRSSNLFYWI